MGVVASFGLMLLAVPVIHRWHLGGFVFCPFHALTGWPCPTCGYTRLFGLAASGNWLGALQFQPFLLVIVIFSAMAAGFAAVSLWRRRELILPRWLPRGIWLALALSWIWNLWHRL